MEQGQACWARDNEGRVRQHRHGENKVHYL